MSISTIFFLIIASLVSYIDIKKSEIPDRVMLPAIAVLMALKYFEQGLSTHDLFAVGIVLIVFILPIAFNMVFGGGDLRFGAFCALYVGLDAVAYFVLFAGLIHLLLLLVLKKRSFGFAPAMSVAALLSSKMELL
jgi:Flp pilus assembly protein protease CpaA